MLHLKPIESAISPRLKRSPGYLIPMIMNAEQFTLDMFSLGDQGEGILSFDWPTPEVEKMMDLVVETDSRFSMRVFIHGV